MNNMSTTSRTKSEHETEFVLSDHVTLITFRGTETSPGKWPHVNSELTLLVASESPS